MKRRDLLLGSLVATACGRKGQSTIAVIPKGTAQVFWQSVHDGAEAAGKQFKVEILWNGAPTETDYTRQVQIVDSMVARRVDGIALAAAERAALVPPVERAVRAGIPVTIFDSGLDAKDYVSFVATDNYAAGRLAAETMASLLGRRGTVGVIMHAPGSVSTSDRERGFRECLEQKHPEVRIVAEAFSMSDRAKALAVTENILSGHPELQGLFASSESSAVGAERALRARHRVGQMRMVAFDASESLVEGLKIGSIDALVVQDPYRIGFEAVRTLADKLQGRTPPRRIDLPAQVVTRADLSRPDVQKLLHSR